MTIEAKVIADSAWDGVRITTLQLRYPRFIHAEFMTHRMFSRNASSSRAIPVSRLIRDVETDKVVPSFWGKNQPGMQAREELGGNAKANAVEAWNIARLNAVSCAEYLHSIGAHKQIVNRILEPFSHINVVVTATEWRNFFLLRNHPDAQPEMQELARAMLQAIEESEPQDQWYHLPYSDDGEIQVKDYSDLRFPVSAARCARVSYLTHEGTRSTLEEDMKLYARLTHASPPHLSPLEHAALWKPNGRDFWANFRKWRSFRSYCEYEGF